MKLTVNEVLIGFVALVGGAFVSSVTVSWTVSAKFAKIESAVEVIPKLEERAGKLEEKFDNLVGEVSEQKGDFKVLKSQVDNIQANAKLTVKQVTKMNKAQQAAGALNSGPYGFAN